MSRSIHRLSPLQVKNLSKPGLHPDGGSLYLNVSASGTKSWRIVYVRNGKRFELGIGPLSSVTLSNAREKAAEARKLLQEGEDPKQHWAKQRPSKDKNFGSIAIEHIEAHEPAWKNAKHRQQWRNTLTTYAATIWDRPVDQITVEDILGILKPIWATKPETASRVRGRIETVLDAAKVRGLRSGENPAAWRGNLALLLPTRKKGSQRHHPAMPFAQVPSFFKDLGELSALTARALELTILTAARTSEVLHAQWSEFDLEAAIWTVSAERMKAGREHRVPLSPPAVKLLTSLQGGHDTLVFPGQAEGKPLSNMSMEMCLRRMKMDRYTVHGFRSSFRDWVGEVTDFPREVAEFALAHIVGSATERSYRRGNSFEKRRELMNAWAEFCLPAV
ncbi:site-specific integrase [Parafrankia sp. BMG5.11]|uniref:tyrosine-type recombinase/integrase n=1 Tax=Parafrankia sp. BMG5.11 TaxID=222540 RepID=UPI00103C73D9|nr:site-specific integrase [Parafrankia sp. BMG5.11]TCJ39586.1 site-specific integrase [Parafrankia sp. BMG5.11]